MWISHGFVLTMSKNTLRSLVMIQNIALAAVVALFATATLAGTEHETKTTETKATETKATDAKATDAKATDAATPAAKEEKPATEAK
jgi:mannitol-specific phosphotransferase system IIBC component